MQKLLLLFLIALLVFSVSCNNPTESKHNPYEQHPIDWPSLADSPWPMYRHDPQLTGRSNFTGPQKGEIVWSFTKPGVTSSKAFTSFAIGSDSTIYFGSSYEPYNGGTQTWYLYAVNPDGAIKWKFRDPEAELYLMTGPLITVEGKIIFAAPGKNGNDIYALDNSGQLSWRYTVTGGIYTAGINIDKEGNLYFCDEFGCIYSLDKDGNLRWKITSSDNLYASDVTAMPISPDGQTLYIANASFTGTPLYAISTDGNIKWSYSCGDSSAYIYISPMVDFQGNVYFLLNTKTQRDTLVEGLYSLKPDGKLRWRFLGGVNSWSEPTIDWDGNIYVYMNDLYTLKNNGEMRFQFELNDYITASLICDKYNNIYAISDIFSIFSSEGSIIAQVALPCETFAAPAMDTKGSLYLGAPCRYNTIIKIK